MKIVLLVLSDGQEPVFHIRAPSDSWRSRLAENQLDSLGSKNIGRSKI